jgi:hypothetical protein
MKDIYFFSCENIALISSYALKNYPQIKRYVLTHVKPVKSVLFFAVKETFVTKETFNSSTPIGFGNVIIESTLVRVTTLLGADYAVKRRLLEYMNNFFTVPIIVEVDMDNQNWLEDISFLSGLGFGDPTPNLNNNRVIDMKIVPGSKPADTLNTVMNIAQQAPLTCKIKVNFPKTLASTLMSYLSRPHEVGGKICITRYGKDPQGDDVAILGFNTNQLILGDPTSHMVEIPADQQAPFSFHTHPDVCYTDNQCFIGWPSSADVYLMVAYYLRNVDILAQFVASSEGIWVIHMRPQFQKVLYELKNNSGTEVCADLLGKFILTSFLLMEGSRSYVTVSPEDRPSIRKKFIDISKNLKMSDYAGTDVEKLCAPFIKEDVLLFDIELIKWKMFQTKNVIMTFSYMLDPAGGLPCKLPVDCGFLAHLFQE